MIAVDWVYGSTGAYPSAVENVTQLALSISQFISKLLVSYCAFPVGGKHGQRTSFMQTIQRTAPSLLPSGAGQAGSLFQRECCVALKRFPFFQSLSPGVSMPLFFLLSLPDFLHFLEKHPSCQLPLQPRTNPKDALGFLRSMLHWTVVVFCLEDLSRELQGCNLRLFYICFGLQIYFL